jgi:hypothetical protein
MKHFGMGKKQLVMTGEREVLYFITRHVPELAGDHTSWDVPIPVALGKSKQLEWKRGDMVSMIKKGYLHIEHDETIYHEDSEDRLRTILCDTEKSFGYVVRICERRGLEDELCRRIKRGAFVYYELRKDVRTQEKMEEVVRVVKERIDWIEQGLEPSEERPWKTKLFFK